MQYIEPLPAQALYVTPQVDVVVDWSQPGAPPSVLLDFAYGAAVFKRWATDKVKSILKEPHERAYGCLRPTPPFEDKDSAAADCSTDAGSGGTGHSYSSWHTPKGSVLSQTIDATLRFSRIIKSYLSPATETREKQEEEAGLHGCEAQ